MILCSHIILLMGLGPFALLTTAPALSRPADAQPATSTAQTTNLSPRDVPITFARSGRVVTAELEAVNFPGRTFVLRAFGRTWSAPVPAQYPRSAKRGIVEFDVPSVRVPTVFAITPADSPQPALGEFVAYPARDVEWDRKIILYSCGAPGWFCQWAAAVGLPTKQIAPADLASDGPVSAGEKDDVLILGPATAGKDLADVAKLADGKNVNVLVLGADWLDDAGRPLNIVPTRICGGLNALARQQWPQPLKFSTHRRPWEGIANRWAWAVDENDLPVVEQLIIAPVIDGTRADNGSSEAFHSLILSYAPWKQQLGRNESADAVLLALLLAAAQSSVPSDLQHDVVVTVWPLELRGDGSHASSGGRPIAASQERPVLSAIRVGPIKPTALRPSHVAILDLRGTTTLPEAERDFIEKLPGRLLILGDDKMLDEWEWLKLDRVKNTIRRPDVIWLSDDELPPSRDNQVRLMLTLTGLGVPLLPPTQEENEK